MADFQTICKDFKDKKGCGKPIIMKIVGKKDDGKDKYKPFNADGAEHKHFDSESKTPAKPLDVEVKHLLEVNEPWVREIVRAVVVEELEKRGLGGF